MNTLQKSSLLYLEDIYKRYGKKTILDDVDLAVASGELITLVGPSGCGKSTLLRLILGQEFPTSGTLLIEGKFPGFPNPERGIVYQKYSLFPHLTVLENVMAGPSLGLGFFERRGKKEEMIEDATHYLDKVKLKEHLSKYPHELSGGMRQRVAIAQSLIMKPKILLMDEPFGALDPGTRESMQIFLLELWEEMKMTVFFVTHDLEEAVFLGTRILVLSQFYTDDRGDYYKGRGAKIVCDYELSRGANPTSVKKESEFGAFIQEVRHQGFDPEYRQHVKNFDLTHKDAFRTIRKEEYSDQQPDNINEKG